MVLDVTFFFFIKQLKIIPQTGNSTQYIYYSIQLTFTLLALCKLAVWTNISCAIRGYCRHSECPHIVYTQQQLLAV